MTMPQIPTFDELLRRIRQPQVTVKELIAPTEPEEFDVEGASQFGYTLPAGWKLRRIEGQADTLLSPRGHIARPLKFGGDGRLTDFSMTTLDGKPVRMTPPPPTEPPPPEPPPTDIYGALGRAAQYGEAVGKAAAGVTAAPEVTMRAPLPGEKFYPISEPQKRGVIGSIQNAITKFLTPDPVFMAAKRGVSTRPYTQEDLSKMSAYEKYVRAALPLQDLESVSLGGLIIPIAAGLMPEAQEEVRYGVFKTAAAALSQPFITKPGEKIDLKGLTEGGAARKRYEERVHPLARAGLEFALLFGAHAITQYGAARVGRAVDKAVVDRAFENWWAGRPESISKAYTPQLKADLRVAADMAWRQDPVTRNAGIGNFNIISENARRGYYDVPVIEGVAERAVVPYIPLVQLPAFTPGGTAVPGQTISLSELQAKFASQLGKEAPKEPWMMTKKERAAESLKIRNETMVKVEKDYIDAISANVPHEKALKDYQEARRKAWATYRQSLEGKPVPQEVLKDYPDLQAKAPVTPEVTKLTEQQTQLMVTILNRGRGKNFPRLAEAKPADFPARQMAQDLSGISDDARIALNQIITDKITDPTHPDFGSFSHNANARTNARNILRELNKITLTKEEVLAIPKAKPVTPEVTMNQVFSEAHKTGVKVEAFDIQSPERKAGFRFKVIDQSGKEYPVHNNAEGLQKIQQLAIPQAVTPVGELTSQVWDALPQQTKERIVNKIIPEEITKRDVALRVVRNELLKGKAVDIVGSPYWRQLQTWYKEEAKAPVTPEVTKLWVVEGKTGLDQVTMRQLPDSRFQITPSYNEQTKGIERQFFQTKDEALAELSKRGKVKEFIKPILEVGSPAELGLEQGKRFTDDFGNDWVMAKTGFKLDTVVKGQKISIYASKEAGWAIKRADSLAKLQKLEALPQAVTPAITPEVLPKELTPLAEEARKYKTFEEFESATFSEEWQRKWRYTEGLMGDIAVMGFSKAIELATKGKYVVSGRAGLRAFWERAQAITPEEVLPRPVEGMPEAISPEVVREEVGNWVDFMSEGKTVALWGKKENEGWVLINNRHIKFTDFEKWQAKAKTIVPEAVTPPPAEVKPEVPVAMPEAVVPPIEAVAPAEPPAVEAPPPAPPPPAPPVTPVAKAPTEPRRISAQLRQMYADLKIEVDAFKAALKGMKGEEAQVGRQTLTNMERELKLVTETLKRFELKQPYPELAQLRKQIVALAVYKGFSISRLREILKETTGTASLRLVPEAQLENVLKKIQLLRPQKIRGKTVIKLDTERDIQSLKASLIADGTLSEDSYKGILKYARLRTDKYQNAENYITESEGKQFIKTLNNEARLGYAQKRDAIDKAVLANPQVGDGIGKLKERIGNLEVGISKGKKATINPFLDTRYYTQKLQATTGQPWYEIWYMALEKRWALNQQAEALRKQIENSTPEFDKLANDPNALKIVNQYIVAKNKMAEIESPADITPSEVALANAIEKVLFDFRGDVRFYRFLRAYNRTDGDVELISRLIPNAPKDDIREAISILESKGDKALRAYTDSKTWGVIQSGYEPEIAVDPRLLERRARITALGAGHLETREEIAFEKQDRNILQRTDRYIKQVLNLQLEPYLQKMDEMYGESMDDLADPRAVKRNLNLALNGLKGYREDMGDLGRAVRAIGSQLLRIRFLLPDKALRNKLQNLAFHPDREAFINPANRRLTKAEIQDFETKVAMADAFAQDYLMRDSEGIGLKFLNRWLDKLSLFPLSERLNRLESYWASLNKAERALKAYNKDGNVGKFLTSSGLNDLTPLQQKQALELLATNKDEAIRFIAREITNNTNYVYTRFEKAPAQMGATGETLGSLLTFTRSYVQRMGLQGQKLFAKDTPTSERMRAFKVLAGTLIGGMVAGAIYRAVTGKDRDEYNPIEIISWEPGGVAVGASIQVGDLLYGITKAISGDEDALMRLPAQLTRAGDSFIPYYEPVIHGLESLSDSHQVDRRALRRVIALLKEDYKPNEEYYKKKRSIIDKFRHTLFGTLREPTTFEEAKVLIPKAIANLGKKDQTGLDDALRQAEADEASSARIAEIKAKDWPYDITSLRRDIGDAIRGLTEKEIAKLPPIAIAYSEFLTQKDAYEDLSTKEQKDWLKDNPDFTTNRVFWSDSGLTTIPDLKTAEAVVALAEKFNIPLKMIPAFQLTDKDKERIPSDRTLWKAYFDYYDLPGTSYLNMTQAQVEAGELPEKHLKDWQTYQKLKNDKVREAFRKGHREASKATWREDFRRKNLEFSKWAEELSNMGQDGEGMKPLPPKVARRRGGVPEPIRLAGAAGGFAEAGISPRRAAVSYPKFKRPRISMAMRIRAPVAPRI